MADAILGQFSDHVADGSAVPSRNFFDLVVQFWLKMNRDDPAATFWIFSVHRGESP
jgi:hypothetical protein